MNLLTSRKSGNCGKTIENVCNTLSQCVSMCCLSTKLLIHRYHEMSLTNTYLRLHDNHLNKDIFTNIIISLESANVLALNPLVKGSKVLWLRG